VRMRKSIIAIGTAAVLVTGIATTASAQPSGTLYARSNLCLLDEAQGVGYCLNDPDASTTNGELMQTWQRDNQGEPNNDWYAIDIGTVSGSSQWPFTSAHSSGNSESWNQEFNGDPVVMLNFAPYNSQTNYCAYADIDLSPGEGETATVNGYTCVQNALDQWWVITVQDGIQEYVNVRQTDDWVATAGSGLPLVGWPCMEGEYSSGALIGSESCVNSIYEDWNWYPRF
jgi:hypothetical protein